MTSLHLILSLHRSYEKILHDLQTLDELKKIFQWKHQRIGWNRNIIFLFKVERMITRVLSFSCDTTKKEHLWKIHDLYLQFIQRHIFTDGSTYDAREHGSLIHHLYVILQHLRLIKMLQLHFDPRFDYLLFKGQHGGSLHDAITLLFSFGSQEKKHFLFRYTTHSRDYVDHSSLVDQEWDRSSTQILVRELVIDFSDYFHRYIKPRFHQQMQRCGEIFEICHVSFLTC